MKKKALSSSVCLVLLAVIACGEKQEEPTQTGTELTYVMEYKLPYSILGKIIDKLVISREIEKEEDLETAFENLKNILENRYSL